MDRPEPKFNVNDVVTLICHADRPERPVRRQPLHIVERRIVDCPGGRQVEYLCRVHVISRLNHEWGFYGERQFFNELELEPFTAEMRDNYAGRSV